MTTELTTNIEEKTAGDQNYTLITLVGQIDETNLDTLGAAVDSLIGGENKYLVFDLARLEFINSKVIGYLAATHGGLSEANQIMIFTNANPNIFDIIELVGLTQIVPTFDQMAQAISAIESGEI